MEDLRAEHDLRINRITLNFKRYLITQIPWNNRLIAIKGFRGTGKTTLLLQYIKQNYRLSEEAIYISLDNLLFTDNTLSEFVADFVNKGGKHIFIEDKEFYHQRLNEIINMIIEIEMPLLRNVDISKIPKIKQLFYIIAQSSPFKPNISKLSERIGITRNTLVEYIKILNDTKLLDAIYRDSIGISLLQKPEKIYLENTNLSFMLAKTRTNTGNARETFLLNQLSNSHKVNYPDKGDFLIDNKYLFEIGGKNKTKKQIAGSQNAFLVTDDIEIGYGNTIPLWLFGFLY